MIARDKECDNAQRCVNVDKLVNETITGNVHQEVKLDQETSIIDAKKTLAVNCEVFGGSSNVSTGSPMSASAANALMEKSVQEMLRRWTVLCRILVVQVRPGLWRSWDMWSSDLSQVFRM